jgi:hypothetical protein
MVTCPETTEKACQKGLNSLIRLETSVCHTLKSVQSLLQALRKKSNAELFTKEGVQEVEDSIVQQLQFLSQIQTILLKKVKRYSTMLEEMRYIDLFDVTADQKNHLTIQTIVKKIKGDEIFMNHQEQVVPILDRISRYYHDKGRLVGVNFTGMHQSSPPLLLLKNRKNLQNKS